jgi:hypothetical protein
MARMADPTVDEVRAHIAAGTCPFCGRGPFAMLPVHTAKAHGVDKWALRDLAHLSSSEPLCSDEARERMRAAYNPDRSHRPWETRASGPPRRTQAGIARNVAAVRTWAEDNPEAYRESLARAWSASARARKRPPHP